MAWPECLPSPQYGAPRYSYRYGTAFGFYVEQREHQGRWVVHDRTGTPLASALTWRTAMDYALVQRPAGWTPKDKEAV